jgi:hypothetical protein
MYRSAEESVEYAGVWWCVKNAEPNLRGLGDQAAATPDVNRGAPRRGYFVTGRPFRNLIPRGQSEMILMTKRNV